jgi:hypothetical protein
LCRSSWSLSGCKFFEKKIPFFLKKSSMGSAMNKSHFQIGEKVMNMKQPSKPQPAAPAKAPEQKKPQPAAPQQKQNVPGKK